MKRIVSGPRAVHEALQGPQPERQLAVVYVEDGARRSVRELAEEASARGVVVEPVPRSRLDALSGALRHQGIVAVGGDYPYRSLHEIVEGARAPALLIALDEVTDPHNLGAIVRSAVALGADGIVLPKHRAARVSPAAVRVSAGATEHARIARVTNLARSLRELREQGLQVVGLDATGETPLEGLPPAQGGRVVVIGSEGRGMRRLVRESCDVLAHIALAGPVESLNASVAAGIAIYEASRDRRGRSP